MMTNQPLPAAHERSVSWLLTGLLTVALLLSIGFLAKFALPYLLLDSDVLARFAGRRAWILTHIATGSVALLVGPIQIWFGFSGKAMGFHRRLGVVYLVSIAVSSLTSFYLAVTTEVSWVLGAGLGGLGCAWVITTSLAYLAVVLRQYQQHQEWMIRSYVVTLGFVFFRVFVGVTSAFEVGTLFDRLNAGSWFCWAFPLLITEAILQGMKLFRRPAAAVSG